MGADQSIVSEILMHLDAREQRISEALEGEYRFSLGKPNHSTHVLNEVLISIKTTKKYIEKRRLEGWKTKNDSKHKQTETF